MFKRLLTNKKIVIVVIATLMALSLGVVFITSGTREANNKTNDTTTEQSKEDANPKDEKDEMDASKTEENKENSGLELLAPNEVAAGDSSHASGDWEDSSDSSIPDENTNVTDKTEDTEKDEDVLKDNISWGEIY